MKALGARIRYARERLGYTQKEAAELVGISNVTFNRYEHDGRRPDPATLKRIADTFRVSADFLLGLTDNPDIYADDLQGSLTVLPRKQTISLERFLEEQEVEFDGIVLTPEEKRDLLGALRILWRRHYKG